MSGRASRHGRRIVDPREDDQAPEMLGEREAMEADPGPGMVEVACSHGIAGDDDTPRRLRRRRIGLFGRMDPAEPWGLWRPSRAAQQGPASRRLPGSWRLSCPSCRRTVPVQDRTLQRWLDGAHDEGVSSVDLWRLTH